MLDCDSRELVFVCAGVLVNMMSDPQRRNVFKQEKGVLRQTFLYSKSELILFCIYRMIDVLQYFGYGDWQLCSLVCQVLWNYCASSIDLSESFDVKETEKIILIMDEYLGILLFFKNRILIIDIFQMMTLISIILTYLRLRMPTNAKPYITCGKILLLSLRNFSIAQKKIFKRKRKNKIQFYIYH